MGKPGLALESSGELGQGHGVGVLVAAPCSSAHPVCPLEQPRAWRPRLTDWVTGAGMSGRRNFCLMRSLRTKELVTHRRWWSEGRRD